MAIPFIWHALSSLGGCVFKAPAKPFNTRLWFCLVFFPSEEVFQKTCPTLTWRLSFLVIIDMHVSLRERDGDAFRVESFLHRLDDIEVHAPVIRSPHTRNSHAY